MSLRPKVRSAPSLDPDLAPAAWLWREGDDSPGAAAVDDQAVAAEASSELVAELVAELLAHGLLLSLALDDDVSREARVRRALAAIPRRQPLRLAPAALSWMAAAVLVFAFGALSIFTLRTEPSAIAMVAGSLEATANGGDRSYRVLMTPQAGGPERIPEARFDMRNREHQRFEAIAPDGSRFVTGRDKRGGWAIRPDGTIDRFPAPTRRPRWIDLGEDLFLAASLDDLLEALPASFEVRLGEPQALPGPADGSADRGLLRRVTATRRLVDEREPERVELWIDPETRLVHRLELHWSERTFPRPPRGERRPGGGRGEPNWRERALQESPSARPPGPPPPPRFGADDNRAGPPDGPGPRPGPGARMPPLGGAFDPPPPPIDGPPRGPAGRPFHGGPGPMGLAGAPGTMSPPPPRHDGEPRLPGMRPMPPRGFLDGPPNFRDRGHPPPPKTIVFELIETESFPEGWFSPEE